MSWILVLSLITHLLLQEGHSISWLGGILEFGCLGGCLSCVFFCPKSGSKIKLEWIVYDWPLLRLHWHVPWYVLFQSFRGLRIASLWSELMFAFYLQTVCEIVHLSLFNFFDYLNMFPGWLCLHPRRSSATFSVLWNSESGDHSDRQVWPAKGFRICWICWEWSCSAGSPPEWIWTTWPSIEGEFRSKRLLSVSTFGSGALLKDIYLYWLDLVNGLSGLGLGWLDFASQWIMFCSGWLYVGWCLSNKLVWQTKQFWRENWVRFCPGRVNLGFGSKLGYPGLGLGKGCQKLTRHDCRSESNMKLSGFG